MAKRASGIASRRIAVPSSLGNGAILNVAAVVPTLGIGIRERLR
jgi:hypothetical protein